MAGVHTLLQSDVEIEKSEHLPFINDLSMNKNLQLWKKGVSPIGYSHGYSPIATLPEGISIDMAGLWPRHLRPQWPLLVHHLILRSIYRW